jgi:uncharacterized protein (TIGR03118 family)
MIREGITSRPRAALLAAALLLAIAPATVLSAAPKGGSFTQTNLVSDQAGVALIRDPDLMNAWGISLNPSGGGFWVSDNDTGVATIYTGDVHGTPFAKASLTVTIPGGAPTGTVFNPTSDFAVSSGSESGAALFLFASQSGVIDGWNPAVPTPAPSTTAQVGATADAVYTGMTTGMTAAGANRIYAADFEHQRIDVYDGSFHPASVDGDFSDPQVQKHYAPFNIMNLGGRLYVSYAQQSHKTPEDETDRATGYVAVFDTDGHLLTHLISGNRLVAPWGMALAPAGFGPFGGALIVGNFANGQIHAYDPQTGALLGELDDAAGKTIVIDGLWGILFGNGVTAGDSDTLYFAAGPDDETHGLFGSLRFTAGSGEPRP